MAMLSQAKGPSHYPCPMCGNPVSATAMICPSCSTDLTRAGAVFGSSSSTVTSVQPRRRRGRTVLWAVLIAGATAAGVGAATVGRPWLTRFMEPGLAITRGVAKNAARGAARKTPPPAPKTAPVTKPAAPAARVGEASSEPASAPAQPAPPANAATSIPAPTAAPAGIVITSTPPGARVVIGGVANAVTPVTLRGLKPGSYKVRIARQGYRPVMRTVRLEAGQIVTMKVSLSVQPVPKPAQTAKPAPASSTLSTLIEVGRPAPPFMAKDRIGVLYRAEDFRGRKLVLVFVQNLDGDTKRLVREVEALHAAGARGALIVVLRPNRVSIREFIISEQVRIPVLFGTQAMGRAYGVGSQPAVLYLISEDGRILARQAGRIDPRAVAN
jgi:hypothetical protein